MKRLLSMLFIGPLTEHCKPPTAESLIHKQILQKPVNLLISPFGNYDSFLSELMFYCRCFLFQHEISELCCPVGMKFCTVVCSRLNFIMPV